MKPNHKSSYNLFEIARQAMLDRDFLTDYSKQVIHELDQINTPAEASSPTIKDLRHLLWFSLDNDDSKDLDQLTFAEQLSDDTTKIFVAIADVDSLVRMGTAIDLHAQHNTTSVYTPPKIFSMLPEKLSTNLTSLNEHQNRLAIIVEVIINATGSILKGDVYQGYVYNHAKLAYDSISDWLDNKHQAPEAVRIVEGLDAQVRLQDSISQKLKTYRHQEGSLTLDTIELRPIVEDNVVVRLDETRKNRGRELIEEFMIAANTTTAMYLTSKNFPTFRRIVRTPERWDRILQLASSLRYHLPPVPDSKALEKFLIERKAADPQNFQTLSLSVIKLIGKGEYVAEMPGSSERLGHFGLALKDYNHSTAPNRRYPDVITQRLLKAAINGKNIPYSPSELDDLAQHCTNKEDDANKVERQVGKSAAAMLLNSRINDTFDAFVTGINPNGTWIRLFTPPVEGLLIKGYERLDVGDRLTVQLVHVDVPKGFIDFIRIKK